MRPAPPPTAPRHRPGSRLSLAVVLAALLGTLGVVAAPTADAAARVTLTATQSATTVDRGGKVTLKVAYRQGTKPITCCSVRLQSKTTGGWKNVRTVKPKNGKASVVVNPKVTTRYRFVTMSGNTRSATRTVTVRSAIAVTASRPTVTSGQASTITATHRAQGRLVAKGVVQLQHRTTAGWVTLSRAAVTSGKATFTVKPATTTSYRVTTTGLGVRSKTVKVTVSALLGGTPQDGNQPPTSTTPKAPAASFTVSGSGYGHGIGMSQYGAYRMAQEGRTAAEILSHYYTGAKVTTATTPEEVAVQVFGASDAATTTFSVSTGSWRLRSGEGTTLRTGDKSSPVTLKVVDGRPVAVVGGTTYPSASWTGDRSVLRLHWTGTRYYSATGAQAVASLSGTHGTYRHGRMTVRVINGHLNIVNELLLNTEYLYGLGEMPSSWTPAALQAQVIAGRNYASTAAAKARSATCDCHVYDDTRSQNFTGWKKESEGTNAQWGKRWTAAVDATVTSSTSAQVLTAGGTLVNAYYFSSSGGRTANSEDVWSATVSYLKSVPDTYSLAATGNSMRAWTRTLTQAKAQSIFGVKDIVSVAVTATYSSGQMKTLTATTTNGTKVSVTQKADRLRSLLSLPASWVTSIAPG
ncbi:SpoIID/LytB domain-containing protein [Sanguibacter hominis ATCC BAA-789]|uniref:SpoIID/LytB domain-containing protein n=1 Tax=Sanguibacter hominis ATCC BAA-789 TaxID=1312740 RepID=A0A9X5IS90_9MICO|nr:SpoIID/LytB domain-containing protein [Sanguibacter hominis]NKX93753.1 SpoIID/LytB domain-containing protein [Sanguibacter hominis ATCC BAA-789]